MTENSVYVPPLVDMFITWPHIFADTQARATCRATWQTWLSGCGQWLRAEYELYSRYEDKGNVDLNSSFFQWDRLKLLYVGTQITRAVVQTRVFETSDDNFIFSVRVYCNDQHRSVLYYLYKNDLANNISISLSFYAYGYSQLLAEVLSWADKDYAVIARQNNIRNQFDITGAGRVSVSRKNHYCNLEITSHNIYEIIAFMKTSRTDLVNYLPRYSLVLPQTSDLFFSTARPKKIIWS